MALPDIARHIVKTPEKLGANYACSTQNTALSTKWHCLINPWFSLIKSEIQGIKADSHLGQPHGNEVLTPPNLLRAHYNRELHMATAIHNAPGGRKKTIP